MLTWIGLHRHSLVCPPIKTIPALVLSAMILPATTEGAVIIANEVYLTIADGGGTLVSAEAATVPTNAWFRGDLPMPPPDWPPLNFGWMALGCGTVTLPTDPGETVSSVTIYLGDGPNGQTPWSFALLSYGETPEIQIWQSTNSLNGNGVPGGMDFSALQPRHYCPLLLRSFDLVRHHWEPILHRQHGS